MFVDFEEMPGDARVWIYQSDRAFTDEEVLKVISSCGDFLTQWTAHGAGLKSSAKVFHNRFLVICVDEAQALASGCSIDSSVHFVQSLGKALNTDFFNRTTVAFLIDDKINTESLGGIRKGLNKDSITADTMTFNNLVQYKSELGSKWIIPVSDSWLGRYFKTQNV